MAQNVNGSEDESGESGFRGFETRNQETFVEDAPAHPTVRRAGTIWTKKCEALPDTNGYPNAPQEEEEEELMPRNDDLQSLVEALLYVAVNTRPDTWADWTDVKWTIRYRLESSG